MQATIKDGKLIIEIDLQTPPVPSASGKTPPAGDHSFYAFQTTCYGQHPGS